MRNKWYEDHHRLEGAMLAVAATNGWLAYEFGSKHPIMAFLHGAMAVALVLGVVFCWKLGRWNWGSGGNQVRKGGANLCPNTGSASRN